MPTRSRVSALVACLLAGALSAQQGSLTLSLATGPIGFATTSTTTCGGTTLPRVSQIVRTEPLTITLQSTPTIGPPPVILTMRRVALYLGPRDCSGSVTFNGSPVFIMPTGALPLVPVIDSFANAFDPKFAAVAQPTSIQLTHGADFFGPYAGALPPLVLQAIAEDLPGSPTPILLSNPVELDVIDPVPAFAPTLSNIASSAPPCAPSGGPGGPEAGGTTITLTGTNLPVHTNWMQFTPTVTVGNVPATNVVLLSTTTATAVTPGSFPATCPPSTPAGPRDVTFRNHPAISPLAPLVPPALSPVKFTYCSGRTPHVTGFLPATPQPEGGQSLLIQGTDFLFGADVVFTAQGALNLTTTISPPNPDITAVPGSTCQAPTATRIAMTTPPFCAGPVTVIVVNPDGTPSAPMTLDYAPLVATTQTVSPMITIPGLAAPNTYVRTTRAGGPISVSGFNFVSPQSSLFGAPTVPQGPAQLHPTETQVIEPSTGTVLCSQTAGVLASNLINVTPCSFAAAGPFRPTLGVKWLRVLNPPCVDPNPPAASESNTLRIVVQDTSAPTVNSLFPNVIVPSGPGGYVSGRIKITGTNFFARRAPQSLPFTQTFASTAPPNLSALETPAVAFGSLFSREVQLVSETELYAKVPDGVASLSVVPVKVFNPDGQSATAPDSLLVVPRLTDPTQLTQGLVTTLDGAALAAIATVSPANPFLGDGSIVFAPNITANEDRLEDIANGGDPAVTSIPSAYDGAFVFNTADATGAMRCFDFHKIDVPATFVLPAPIVFGPFMIAPGIKRVIFKATSFALPLLQPSILVDHNYPLVLRSHDDFTFSGILDVSGQSLVNQTIASSPTLKFQVRCGWQIPPAAGGIGGRGGLDSLGDLIDLGTPGNPLLVLPGMPSSLAQPSLGTTAAQLQGRDAYEPRVRFPGNPVDPITWGHHGLGRAPFGGKAGGGGGGGFAPVGTSAFSGSAGQAGVTASAAAGGYWFGNRTHLSSSTPAWPSFGDCDVYGATAADFAGPLGFPGATFPSGLFTGGSGGGGGGGSLAVVVPCVSVGGRGGNGGGAAVLLSDRVFKLGALGRIYADGEKGQLGVDAFPIANSEPLFVLCAPGSGGGGSGGLVFIAAVADVDLTAAAASVSPGQRFISALGGGGGAPTGTTTVITANGGAGGPGRIRIVVNSLSSMMLPRQAAFLAGVTAGGITPGPSTLTADFFGYPSP